MPPSDPEKEYEPRVFCCGVCGYILGECYREIGKRITQLRTYRIARDFTEGIDQRVMLPHMKFSMVKCNDGLVLCDHCGGRNGWYANQTAIAEMLERKNNRAKEVVET